VESRFQFVHLTSGILAFLVFLASGIYMRMIFPDVYSENESIRFLFRANHIYILFSALLNVSLGMYVTGSVLPPLKLMHQSGSLLVALSPILFVIAFLVEPLQASPSRPLTIIGVFATTVGLGLHVFTFFWKRKP